MSHPVIDNKLCNKCYACIEECPEEIFSKDDEGGVFIIDNADEFCTGDDCEECVLSCPVNAIEIDEENNNA